jgi:hypothetical protein
MPEVAAWFFAARWVRMGQALGYPMPCHLPRPSGSALTSSAECHAVLSRSTTVGLSYGPDFLPDFEPEAHDLPLDAILNDYGVVWPV